MIMPFGKFKGLDLEDIPSSYLRWLLEKVDDEALLNCIEEELRFRDDHDAHFEDD